MVLLIGIFLIALVILLSTYLGYIAGESSEYSALVWLANIVVAAAGIYLVYMG